MRHDADRHWLFHGGGLARNRQEKRIRRFLRTRTKWHRLELRENREDVIPAASVVAHLTRPPAQRLRLDRQRGIHCGLCLLRRSAPVRTFGTTGATGTSTADSAVVTPHRSIPGGAYKGRDFRVVCPGWTRYTPERGGAHTIFFIAPSSRFRRRGLVDAALVAVLYQGVLRRSEAAALTWRDVTEATTDDGLFLTIRQSKTKSPNPRRRGAGGMTPEFRSRPPLPRSPASSRG